MILAAAWRENGGGGHGLHIHNKRGDIIKSLFPISEVALKNNLVCDGIFFDLDRDYNIYAVQEMDYRISKYTVDGHPVKSFSQPGPDYIPPPKAPFKHTYLRSKLTGWIKSWTHVVGLTVSGNRLFVSLGNYDPADFGFVLDLYDTDGHFIRGGLKTNYRLLHVDDRGVLYFLHEEMGSDLAFKILKFSIRESRRAAPG
jgi:hypothetical protein